MPRFAPPVRYAVSADIAVLAADLDGDGAPEILTSGNSVVQQTAFSLLRNTGDGTFADERLIGTGLGERIEDVADVNRDGVPDLLASDYWNNGMVIHHGLGSGEFAPRVPLGTATHGGPTRVVDVDRDAIPDVLSLSFGSLNPVRVHVFRGRDDGALDPKTTFDTTLAGATSPSIRIHDGAVEILANHHSGHVAVLRVTPGGVTWSTREAGPGFDLTSVFADVNGDGHADIIDTNEGDGEANPHEWIFVTLAAPGGGFLERKQLENARRVVFPTRLRTGDFDRDGRLDLIAGSLHATTLYWFRGRGDGSFDDGVAIDAGGPVNDVAVADLNRDSRPDLATVNDDGSVSVILNARPCAQPRRRAVRH